jgi:hypothetical protein
MVAKVSRVPLIGALSIGVLCLPASVKAQEGRAIAEQIAKTYGVDSWGQVEAIGFTFNIEKPKVSRSWVWEPKADRITYDGPDKEGKPVKITYVRSQLASQSDFIKEAVDPAFINDQYALMFPLHLAWDTALTVQEAGTQKLPLGKGSARKVVVKYPSGVGYTPGDTWDLYLANDGTIQQLVLHHGGSAKPSLVPVTWAGNKKAGELLFSTDKRGTADGNPIRLFFTNVAVKQVGLSTWIAAK